MIDFKFAKLLGAAALALTLAACNGGGSGTTASTDSDTGGSETTQTAPADNGFDAAAFYVGQWRGSVVVTGETVYGTAGGNEPMLDVILAEDGTVTVTPLEAHADLLSDSGTWEGTESQLTLHLSGGDIVLTVTGTGTMTGNAADFDIADFETINFDFFG